MKKLIIVGVSALTLGAAGGYFAGKSEEGKQATATTAPDAATRDSRKARTDTASPTTATAKDKKARSLDGILSMSGGVKARTQALMDYYSGMTADQLTAEADKLSHLPIEQKMMASLLLYGRWAEVDPQGALAQTNKMGFEGAMLRPTVLQGWASSDPQNAAKYFSANPREFVQMGGPGGNSASVIASEWAKLDPESAMTWAGTLTSGQDKSGALASIVREIAAKDPAKAVAAAAGLTGDDQTRADREIAGQWGATDFTAAKAWIDSLPAEARDQAMASALSSFASKDPVKASAEIASMTAGDSKNQAISQVAQAWASTDPAAAAAWVVQQGDNTDNAIRGVMTNWATQNSTAALAFIEQQQPGTFRDQAVASYVMANRSADPSTAVTLAETITDERDRDRTVGMSAMRWMQEDPVAAKEYVQGSTTLSDRAKEMILSGRGPWGGPGGFGRGR